MVRSAVINSVSCIFNPFIYLILFKAYNHENRKNKHTKR